MPGILFVAFSSHSAAGRNTPASTLNEDYNGRRCKSPVRLLLIGVSSLLSSREQQLRRALESYSQIARFVLLLLLLVPQSPQLQEIAEHASLELLDGQVYTDGQTRITVHDGEERPALDAVAGQLGLVLRIHDVALRLGALCSSERMHRDTATAWR